MRYLALLLLSLAASFAGPSQAQEPPGRVGRIAYIQGTVSVYQDPDLGWDKAYVNTPITSENSVWTERGSRAEIRVAGVAMRVDETTQLDISRLDEDDLAAAIERGSAHIRLRYKQPNDRITIDTPHARFTLQADGRYRIDVDPEREESRLTVFAGDARMESQGGRIRVATGTTVRVFGGPQPSYVTERATSDAFDRWADARDKDWTDSRSRQYVSTDMTGYEELDRYGQWSQDADYGALWFPTRVASDWAPYRTGHWAHVRPWGWTWVDDAPWGYAPFHYGRWVSVGNRWAWSPGERVARPAWAPALVGWVGGSNWSIGISSGASAPVVGWYPLAPWERYEPSYRVNRAYVDRLNIAVRDRAPRNHQGRGDDWRRYNRERAATVVQRDVMIDRRPVQSARVQVGVEALRQQQNVAPAQVQQVLPQGNEMIRRTRDRNQAPIAAPPVQQAQQAQPAQQPQQGGRQQGQRGQQQGQQAEGGRPRFGGFAAPAPVAAPANQPPPSAANPAARGGPAAAQQQPQQQQQQQAREAQERAAREAQVQQQNQLQRQQQEAAAREAQQQQQNQLQRQTREAQQQQERAAREAQQQREAQQRQQQEAAAREAQQQQQNQLQRQTREAQQQQERAAKEAQQQREAQQRQQQEAAAREAQQQQQAQQQRQAREAQQAQQRAAQEAQQQQLRQQQQLQQQQERAAKEAQQQAQRAQQEAQQAAQRAAQEAQQQQNRAARGGQPQPQPQAQQPQAQPQPAQQPQGNPAARGGREQQQQREKEEKEKKDKEQKDKEQKDKEEKEKKGK